MLTEQVVLDITRAEAQIDQLEAELRRLSSPINVPVDVGGGGEVDALRRDLGQADDSVEQLNRELDQTDRELDQIEGSARRAAGGVDDIGRRGTLAFGNLKGAVAGVVGILGALAASAGVQVIAREFGAAIQSAASFNEAISKTNVVFGQFADEVEAFAATGPEALGLSNQAALEATATFGNLFTALGLSQQAAADLSPDIVQLAADLASFNDTSVDDALTALRSGLVGEVEPLRRLGVAINAASVEAKALELGLVGVNGEVSEAAKVQARYALILEQTTNAQGDFARTADGVANRQRSLVARFEDLRREVGEALLPAFEEILKVAPQIVDAIEGMVPAIASAAQSFGDFVASTEGVFDRLGQIQQGFGALGDVFGVGRSIIFESTEIFSNLARLDFGNFIGDIREAGSTIGDFQDRLQLRGIIIAFIEDLQGGADASDAFARRFAQALRQTQFGIEAFDRLANAAGLSDEALEDVLRTIVQFPEQFQLSAVDALVLRNRLIELAGAAQEFSRRTPGGGAGISQVTQDFDDLFGTITGSVPAAVSAIGSFDSALAQVNQTILRVQFDQLQDEIEASARAFADITDPVEAARDALRDAEGEIIEDFETFFANFQAQLAARQAFADNLALLRALGLDELADLFQAQGLEAAAALADAVANPEEAARANSQLEENARNQATVYEAEFRRQLLDLFIANPLIAPIIADITGVRTPEFFGAPGDIPRGGEVTVNINNPRTNDLNSDAARAAQVIGSVVRDGRRLS
jgi:hypothetical protein